MDGRLVFGEEDRGRDRIDRVRQTRPCAVEITTWSVHRRMEAMACGVVGFGGRDQYGPYLGFPIPCKHMTLIQANR